MAQEKASKWTAVCYPENMLDGWEEQIGHILQLPFAYCLHHKDGDSKSEHRKDHIHIIIVWPGPTTYTNALKVVQKLSKPGAICCNTVQAVINVRYMYDYLIHDTETARKEGKELYRPEDRITGNNFDIGAYEQLGAKEKNDMALQLCMEIIDQKIMNFADFLVVTMENHEGDVNYFEVIKSYSGLFDRTINGVWKKYGQAKGDK